MRKSKRNLFLAGLLVLLLAFPAGAMAIELGPLDVGGAIRANYLIGDYEDEDPSAPSSAEDDGGNFVLDTFRINLDYEQDQWVGKAEYRFYDGYHFLHTGWMGYNFDEKSQLQVGVNRVPFGPGPYGVSQSWLFDQHYYVGLSDDMDLGAKYITSFGKLKMDFAYYVMDEGNYFGSTEDSSRYSYDVVNESGDGYEEEHQFNIRAVYPVEMGAVKTDLGGSLQYGMLDSNGPQDDGSHWAGSIHAVNKFNNWNLTAQLTYYDYDVEKPDGSTADLVQFGAYDFPTLVAAEAWIPAVSLSYYLETPQIDFLDYMIPYVEYSSIIKDESDFNDSEMWVLGAAWARGGWYIYTDLAYSNGNDFVGGEPFNDSYNNRFGDNPNDEWQYRFNINFGYYF
ncbi:hypothetical protein HNR65_000085 [Desulfosalsimonas propionicica]|uniref:Phosphate-selective porin O and P n=1 Tax=Desulfosalsimonas propionicica TaxID=332175 RepID=A0A7W0C5W2_9BACT|nr:hypothetical protein [Desulfosalsimonas propionicica]MBA2879778.1 hypothetical protein [Desulfosalsimonas propionicica]